MSKQPTRRILVVDDEERVREAVKRVLTEAGYHVYLAVDGKEGLSLVEKESPDLVLVDLMMPVMDGMEFLDQARRHYPELTSVVITGFATLEKAVEAMKQGADDFLAKPFKPRDLKLVVERALRRAATLQDISIEKSRTRALIKAMTNGVLVVDSHWEIALVNPALAQLFGYKEPEDMQGKTCRDALPWSQVCDCLEALIKDEHVKPKDCRCQCSLGEGEDEVHLQVTCAPFYDARETLVGAMAVFDDVTAWHKLDQYKSEFVSTVAHEIISPLGSVQAHLHNIMSGLAGPLEDKQKDILEKVRNRIQGVVNLSRDLLDLAKIEAGVMGEMREVQLAPILKDVMAVLEARAQEKKQKLSLEIAAQLPTVAGVAEELHEVILNLTENAVKYSPEGGSIILTAQAQEDEVAVAVTDTGLGISPQDQKEIFKRFYRIKNADTRHITGTAWAWP